MTAARAAAGPRAMRRACALSVVTMLTLSGVVFACSERPTAPPRSKAHSTESAPALGQAVAKPDGGAVTGPPGRIVGVVTLTGIPPKPKSIDMASDKICARIGGRPTTRGYRTRDGALLDVLVHVKNPPAGEYAAPAAPVVLDQIACRFDPRVLGIQIKQPLMLINSDPTLHNVHAYGKQEFNLAMPTQGQRIRRKFKRPELMLEVRCDIHPWMAAWIGVLKHPFFATTSTAGAFSIPGLPAGTYELEAWHPSAGTRTVEAVVASRAEVAISFEFSVP